MRLVWDIMRLTFWFGVTLVLSPFSWFLHEPERMDYGYDDDDLGEDVDEEAARDG